MKTLKLIVPLLTMLTCLSGCSNSEKGTLTYGYCTTQEKAIDVFKSIKYGDLSTRVDNEESMLVVTYYGEGSSCSCWSIFKSVTKEYNEKYHSLFYLIPYYEFTDKTNTFGMTIPTSDTVSLSIFNKGKLIRQWVQTASKEFSLFKDVNSLRDAINKEINDPILYYVDEANLDSLIAKQQNVFVYYAKTGCPDCESMEYSLLFPYLKSNSIKDNIYILDVATFKDTKYPDTKYQEIKDKYGLSNTINTKLGFGSGVMPTLQIYENKAIKDMAVIYNDSVSKVAEGQYAVTSSYYDGTRDQYFKYMNNVSVKDLTKLTLTDAEVDKGEYGGVTYYSWNHKKADIYYQPIFNAFLDTYLKK